MPIPSQVLFLVRNVPIRLRTSSRRLASTLSLNGPIIDTAHSQPTASHISSTSRPSSPKEFLRQRNLNQLRQALIQDGSPSHVWECYTNLVNVMGHEKLPLEIHREVLRRCTPSSSELRVTAARRLTEGIKQANPHIHERRFQTVIRNIRADDALPTLEDYHFILEQFAAVGHHVGSMHVYKELKHMGWKPRTKTFGLCLQAIAHRLTLPIAEISKSRRIAQTRLMLADLMTEMQTFGIPFTSVNLDLTIRILKETLDVPAFETLMKWGYGIDLANPDRLPLEYFGTGTIRSDLGLPEPQVSELPQPQPFSTAALNTTIDIIGRFGDVSKLVQAFEVLTQPLPRASQHLFTSFDDDDDFGLPSAEIVPSFPLPHARPNITSYNTLLRYLCRAGHATLARHYLNEVKWLDHQHDKELRRQMNLHIPLDQLPAPHLSINRATLLPVFGESNRDKNMGLMRWLLTKIPYILRRKRSNLTFYTAVRKYRSAQQTALSPATGVPDKNSHPSSSHPSHQPLSPQHCPPRKPHAGSVFELDLDSPPPIKPSPVKNFDIDLHIRLLERDLEELEVFAKYAEDVYGRNMQRVKERLGRRVWSGQDVYLSSANSRVLLGRDAWKDMAGFQSRRPVNALPRGPPPSESAASSSNRPFSTFFSSNNSPLRAGAENASPNSQRVLAQLNEKLQNW